MPSTSWGGSTRPSAVGWSRGREAGDVADIADGDGRHDGADPEELGRGRLRSGDHSGDPFLGVAHLGVDAAQVFDELEGELVSGRLDCPSGLDAVEQSGRLNRA